MKTNTRRAPKAMKQSVKYSSETTNQYLARQIGEQLADDIPVPASDETEQVMHHWVSRIETAIQTQKDHSA